MYKFTLAKQCTYKTLNLLVEKLSAVGLKVDLEDTDNEYRVYNLEKPWTLKLRTTTVETNTFMSGRCSMCYSSHVSLPAEGLCTP